MRRQYRNNFRPVDLDGPSREYCAAQGGDKSSEFGLPLVSISLLAVNHCVGISLHLYTRNTSGANQTG